MVTIDGSDRWDDALQAVVAAAAHEAATLLPEPEPQIGTYHLLLGILSHGESRSARYLVAEGLTYEELRSAVASILMPRGASSGGPTEPTIEPGTIVFDPIEATVTPIADERGGHGPYTRAAETALRNAARMTDGPIDVECLFMAMLEELTVGTGLLVPYTGKPLDTLRRRARRYLG